MKKNIAILFYALVVAIITTVIVVMGFANTAHATPVVVAPVIVDPLTHPQRVWTYALEWCESRGNIDAINKMDKDGTPSYYSWQFKPGTFKLFANLYGVVPTSTSASTTLALMHDYPTEQQVIDQMVLHGSQINWHQQFPDCVAKLGTPPKIMKVSPTPLVVSY